MSVIPIGDSEERRPPENDSEGDESIAELV
jgi:hypothetical protein